MKKIYLFLFFLSAGLTNAQIVTIPDAAFKNRLVSDPGINTNGDEEIQVAEAEAVTFLDVSFKGIFDLTGIQAFTNMTWLDCWGNNLTSIDLQILPNLTGLRCSGNPINNGNFYLPSSLTYLECSGCGLQVFNSMLTPNLTNLNCSNNALTFLDLSNMDFLQELRCSNNFISNILLSPVAVGLTVLDYGGNFCSNLDLSPYQNLQELRCNNNQISSISLFEPQLKKLDVSGNQLTMLDLTFIADLRELDCDFNQLTGINVSAFAALERLKCANNQITSVDFTNNTALKTLSVSFNPITSLDVNFLTNLEWLEFGGDSLPGSVNISSLVNLSHLVISGIHQTAFNFENLDKLAYLVLSTSGVTSIDVSGCPMLNSFYPTFNTSLAYINMKNGANIVQFQLGNQPSALEYICTNESDLPLVQSELSAQGLTGVTANTYCSFFPGGDYNTISGLVHYDADNNGCDASDAVMKNLRVNISDTQTSGSTVTESLGNYTFLVQQPDITIAPALENPSYFNVTPASATFNFPENDNTVSTQDFCIAANGNHQDLEIVVMPIVPARPGFDAIYQIVYKNKGTQPMSQNYGISFSFNPNQMHLVSAIPAPVAQNPNSMNWDFANLKPFESRSIVVIMNVNPPTDANPVNINDVLNLAGVISPMNLDEIPSDNTFLLHQTVVGSYDPNDIQCLQGETVAPSEIGNFLHYAIRFENTGTAAAQNIVVRESIDPAQFDIASLQLLNASHNVEVRITGNILELIFRNIYLETGGHGNILLKVRSKGDLQAGDSVSKKAGIYFDYNFPVETNLETTIFQTLSTGFEEDLSIAVSPNPARDIIRVEAGNTIGSVQLYDVQGRLLQAILVNDKTAALDISAKAAGVYFLKVTSEKGIKVEKIVKK